MTVATVKKVVERIVGNFSDVLEIEGFMSKAITDTILMRLRHEFNLPAPQ